MDQEILNRLNAHDEKLEAIYTSVEKTRKYFLWTLIVTIVTVVLPLIALMFVLPTYLQTLGGGTLGI
ncbi:MAG: hypothetical protein PHW95_05105 [Patescibacteria group bacterium]|nr:hypothetical protein [Patescibacteria group bacterium]